MRAQVNPNRPMFNRELLIRGFTVHGLVLLYKRLGNGIRPYLQQLKTGATWIPRAGVKKAGMRTECPARTCLRIKHKTAAMLSARDRSDP